MTPKPTICYVIWSLGLGGAEQVVCSLARRIDRNKFRVIVACLNTPGHFAAELGDLGVKVFALNKAGPLDIGIVRRLMRLFKQQNVKLVHTHLFGANTWGRLAARLTAVKSVATEHNMDVWKRLQHRIPDNILARTSDRVVAVSKGVGSFYRAWGIPEKKLQVIYNGVDTDRLARAPDEDAVRALRESYGFDDSDVVIGWAGRMVPAKRLDNLLAAFSDVATRVSNSKLMLIGDGPDRNDVERQAHGLGLAGKIVFAGFQSEIAPYYHAIDMLVLSSDREGHPMVALEAMASGRPVVATRVGGVPEVIVENENGKMVAPDNSEALAKALCHYVNDSEERRHHGLEAQKRVRDHFSVEAMVSQHELLYQEVLGEIEC